MSLILTLTLTFSASANLCRDYYKNEENFIPDQKMTKNPVFDLTSKTLNFLINQKPILIDSNYFEAGKYNWPNSNYVGDRNQNDWINPFDQENWGTTFETHESYRNMANFYKSNGGVINTYKTDTSESKFHLEWDELEVKYEYKEKSNVKYESMKPTKIDYNDRTTSYDEKQSMKHENYRIRTVNRARKTISPFVKQTKPKTLVFDGNIVEGIQLLKAVTKSNYLKQMLKLNNITELEVGNMFRITLNYNNLDNVILTLFRNNSEKEIVSFSEIKESDFEYMINKYLENVYTTKTEVVNLLGFNPNKVISGYFSDKDLLKSLGYELKVLGQDHFQWVLSRNRSKFQIKLEECLKWLNTNNKIVKTDFYNNFETILSLNDFQQNEQIYREHSAIATKTIDVQGEVFPKLFVDIITAFEK